MFLTIDFSKLGPSSGQSLVFDVATIVFAVIIVIGMIVGIKRGFVKALILFLSGIVSVVIAYYLSGPVSKQLMQIEGIYNPILNFFSNTLLKYKDGALNVEINQDTQASIIEMVKSTFKNVTFIVNEFEVIIKNPESQGQLLYVVLAAEVTKYLFVLISGLLCWLVLFIILRIIGHFAEGINKVPLIGPVNRLLGGIFGALESLLTCGSICVVCYLLFSLNLGNEKLSNIISYNFFGGLGNDSNWSFAQGLYYFVAALFEK